MKKLSKPVKGDAWEHIEGEWRACTDAVFKADTFPLLHRPSSPVAQGPGRAEGEGEDQIMKPTSEGKMKSPSEMSDIELREAVAVEVMGWTKLDRVKMGWGEGPQVWGTGDTTDEATGEVRGRHGGPTHQGFEPESSIEAAFEVADKMRGLGWHVSLCAAPKSGWCCTMLCEDFSNGPKVNTEGVGYWERQGCDDYAPRAICIAALTAVRARKA